MPKKLQLLVPHFDEAPEEMAPLLDSVAIQQSVGFADVGVVIAHDGPGAAPLPEAEWAARYPFGIGHVRLPEHGGVSAARNAALDAATADYVMFCDADDMLLTANALYTVLQLIEREGFDTLVSCFMEEQKTETVAERMARGREVLVATFGPAYAARELPEFMYIPHEADSTFVHGKVHRRGYLIDKSIRFDESLKVHEDSYFNVLAQQLADPDRAKYWPQPFYLWKWRDRSVCRHDPKYLLKTLPDMLETVDRLVRQFVRRGLEEKAKAHCASCVYDVYYTMNMPDWTAETNAAYRAAAEGRFRTWFAAHRGLWERLAPEVRAVISEQQRARHIAEGLLGEAVTLDQWLEAVTRDE